MSATVTIPIAGFKDVYEVPAVEKALHELPQSANEGLRATYLYTADMPDPDLIIRTAGEARLSNYLLWQAAYAEFWFTPVFWPDFDKDVFYEGLQNYSQRKRLPDHLQSASLRLWQQSSGRGQLHVRRRLHAIHPPDRAEDISW